MLKLNKKKKKTELLAIILAPKLSINALTQRWEALEKSQYFNSKKYNSGAPRAKRASGAPWVNKSTHPRKFGNHVTERPSDRPSAPQAYQCLLSHFLATLGAQEKADCTSMLSSIDSCQNRVSADQYHLIVSRAQMSTHQGRVFFELFRWQFTRFQMIAGSRLLFIKYSQTCCARKYKGWQTAHLYGRGTLY